MLHDDKKHNGLKHYVALKGLELLQGLSYILLLALPVSLCLCGGMSLGLYKSTSLPVSSTRGTVFGVKSVKNSCGI